MNTMENWKELGKVVGGVLGSIRPGGNASGKDFIG